MVSDQHADAACLEESDDALDLDHGDRIDTGEGLIQQDETRLGGQRTGDFDPAALTTGQCQRWRVTQLLHPQVLQQGHQPLFNHVFAQRPALRITLQLQHGLDVFAHAQLAEDGGLLRQVGQPQPGAAVDGHLRHRLAVDQDVAAVRAHQPDDHVERGGLARAVGAEQAHHFAFLDRQRHVLDDLAAAVGLLQVACFQPAASGIRTDAPRIGHQGVRAHLRSPPRTVLERRPGADAAAAGATGADAALRGARMARTRPPGLAALALAGLPSTVKMPVRLL